MRVLAIDTSASVGSVAVGPLDALRVAPLPLPAEGRRPVHGRLLAPTVAECLADGGWAPTDIELCVIGLGPGSYTGIRIGLAFVKGFALAADCPIVGISSLEVLAHNGPAAAGEVLVVRDAKWGEVYWARFRRGDAGWDRVSPDAIGVGTELGAAGAEIVDDRDPPDAAVAARIGVARYRTHGAGPPDGADGLAPLYLRPTEAERRLAGRG